MEKQILHIANSGAVEPLSAGYEHAQGEPNGLLVCELQPQVDFVHLSLRQMPFT